MSYLDKTGLTYLWTKLKSKFADIVHKHAGEDITSGTVDAARLPVAGASASGIVTTGAQTFSGVKTLNDNLVLYKESTTEEDLPARIMFSTKDTTANTAYTGAYIAMYHANKSGSNLVINTGGSVLIGGGEAGINVYNAAVKKKTNEYVYIVADGLVFIEANANTTANRIGFAVSKTGELVPVKAEVTTDNIGAIGRETARWANGYFTKLTSDSFDGSGADLTDLNASELASGTVPTARLPVATEDENGIVNASHIRKMNELWEVHEAATINNSVVSGAFAITINTATSWRQDSYTNYWYTKINLPTIKRGAEIVIRYDDCQFLYMLEPPEDGWIEALDGEVWLYTKTQPTFYSAVDHVRISGYFINHTSIDSGIYDPPFKMELVWENASDVSQGFLAQTLDLDMHAYDMALVETQALPSDNDMGITYETGFISKGVPSAIMGVAKTGNRTGLRKFTMTDAGIEVGDGIYNGAVNFKYFVPTRIFGIRGFGAFDVEPVWETWLEEGEENNTLFSNGFEASPQRNGNSVLDYGWDTYDGNTGWLIHTRAQSNSWAYLYSEDKIDLTNYSYILITCYFNCYGGAACVGVSNLNKYDGAFPTSDNPASLMHAYAQPVDTRTLFRGEVRINVKELTGEYRLVIACAGSGNSNYEGYSMIISAKAR